MSKRSFLTLNYSFILLILLFIYFIFFTSILLLLNRNKMYRRIIHWFYSPRVSKKTKIRNKNKCDSDDSSSEPREAYHKKYINVCKCEVEQRLVPVQIKQNLYFVVEHNWYKYNPVQKIKKHETRRIKMKFEYKTQTLDSHEKFHEAPTDPGVYDGLYLLIGPVREIRDGPARVRKDVIVCVEEQSG